MVDVANLSFRYYDDGPYALKDISLSLINGSRTILIGANGAGKSTLLQILAGKRLISAPNTRIQINGRDVFRDCLPSVMYLGTEWAANPVVRGDISVSAFLDSVGGYRHKERRDRLLDILDVDLEWRMHAISDGERRRVQLCMGLMQSWDVLLLDEITVDLDVLVRDDLLSFLKNDSETRGSIIIYATHVFDGLSRFPTHVAHMQFGSLIVPPTHWPFSSSVSKMLKLRDSASSLYDVAIQWLKQDRIHRSELERQGLKLRGARRDDTVPSDSETFYKKYDYQH